MANPLHDTVFNFLEEYRSSHLDFLYWLRERNTGNRLMDGYWFQGNLDYAYVGLYDRSGGSNKTRSIGIYFTQSGQNIKTVFEVVFNEEEDERLLKLYAEIMKRLGGFNRLSDTRFQKTLSTTDGLAAAKNFLTKERPVVDEAIREMNLEEIFIEKDDFDSKLKHILSIKDNPASSLFPPSKIEELKRKYAAFKNDEFFKERVRQLRFIPFAQKVISNFLKNDLTNETLTGLIQVLKNGAKGETVNYHIDKNIADVNLRAALKKEFSEFGFTGYTGAGKTGINGLDDSQLETVKKFILDCTAINTIEEGNKRVEEFDTLKTPQVKCGVYSPWLYYMNPSVFPIKNNSHDGFIQWCNQPTGSYPKAILLFHEVAEILGEEDLGLIDAFTHMFSNDSKIEVEIISSNKEISMSLNTILYGPPGTGKTYHTINKSVAIANPQFAITTASRDQLKAEYERLVKDGQIEFITFHQSMSYEDFIEGIKPVEPKDSDSFLKYIVRDGIFKRICKTAAFVTPSRNVSVEMTEDEFEKAGFFKLSLGNSQKQEDDEIYRYCIDNNVIALGWGEDIDFTGKSESEINSLVRNNNYDPFMSRAVNYFIHYLKVGNYVMISNGNYSCRAIGKVLNEYEYDSDADISYYQFRKVEWLIKDEEIPIEKIYNKAFSQQTIYRLDKSEIKKEFFVREQVVHTDSFNNPKNYVLIIDEINRGNVSQIFGELITLIEEDKRNGQSEALVTTLPYSKELFSVPSNLYILGTMNTADRSVEALDTALRRRFVFEEMLPLCAILSPKKMLCNFWNKPEHLNIEYDEWVKGPYKTKADLFYSLIGFSREQEAAIHNTGFVTEREYWIEDDLDSISNDSFTCIRLDLLLEKINQRLIALLSKDHTIGHAWLMNVYSLQDLQAAFKNKILPLLQEFFYNDYAKIGLVLGKSFVESKPVGSQFAKFNEDLSSDFSDKIIYTLKDPFTLEPEDFISIYQ